MLLLLLACPAPDECRLPKREAAAALLERYPTLGAAREQPTGEDCRWTFAHHRRSVDGMGVTLANLEVPSGISELAGEHDVPAGRRLEYPSLLFFDQTEDPVDDWPLIGAGYHYPYTPCEHPELECIARWDWLVHEAGYHHSIAGDGGMTLATDEDSEVPIDPEGCNAVGHHDLRARLNTVRHGRSWVVHLWLDPDPEGTPELAVTDPWERWLDNPGKSVAIDPAAFYEPSCACPSDFG